MREEGEGEREGGRKEERDEEVCYVISDMNQSLK